MLIKNDILININKNVQSKIMIDIIKQIIL